MHVSRLLLIGAHLGTLLAAPILVARSRLDSGSIRARLEWSIQRTTLYYGDHYGYNWIKKCAGLRHQVAQSAQSDADAAEEGTNGDDVDRDQSSSYDESLRTCWLDYRARKKELQGLPVPWPSQDAEEARLHNLQEARRRSREQDDDNGGLHRLQISSADLGAWKKGVRQAWAGRPTVNVAHLAGAAMHAWRTAPRPVIRPAPV